LAKKPRSKLGIYSARKAVSNMETKESFNGKLRDECLNENWFITLFEAKRIIENWRNHYNDERLHTSLHCRTSCEQALADSQKSLF